ncbi:hypothetical protein [Streptomyces sp. NBC_00690]|uniref:hypothetical protein n=1 Tax=Streptomyces sp. NBC_00690 TaxID=2975808 RepID=UPI002E29FBBC|nr:hypothetical protein [Streptomyces sp. NBC_00690]
MTDQHSPDQEPERLVPRDLPDQQVHDGDDPLDLPPPTSPEESTAPDGGEDTDADRDGQGEDADGSPPDDELPEADEAGAGRGEARSGSVHPEQPVPDEPSG